ncbi:hypothetical protein GCM10028803_27180 [Larkinella knui]|uniref:TlpA family protein disulfide reductase n=1 Tax=Larkinella knui TaxID=2025310 RepID=A0A3P1CWU2_9BACT|nr:TlpA disulfide reductase family protein [Larkinella knui]RRB17763.1 TlpA family protein disulfide reductase [Larkinella knui]
MQTKSLVALLFTGLFLSCQEPEKESILLDLPLVVQEGYGPFLPGFSILSPESDDYPKGTTLGNSSQPVSGIPKNWTNRLKSRIDLNPRQFIYQNFCAGNVDPVWYEGLKEYFKWPRENAQLSRKPIKCYIYVVQGFDPQAGQWAVLVDTNNNLDFSDETAIYPESMDENDLTFPYKNPLPVTYQQYQNGNVVSGQIPLVIKRFRGNFVYNFPQYMKAVLKRGSQEYEIAVSSGNFNRLSTESVQIAKKPSWFWQKKVKADELVEVGDYLTLDGTTYKNKGVDLAANVLQLERINPDFKEFLLQTGHPFLPFKAKEFTTGAPFSLDDYKGKYVFIDFWATWCKGCVADMPELKKLHQKLDPSRFAFLGVVAEDSPERARAFLQKQALTWPQIFSDSTDQLTQFYGITGLPVTVLLDPTGKIIAKDLRGKSLADKLTELDAF